MVLGDASGGNQHMIPLISGEQFPVRVFARDNIGATLDFGTR